MSYGFKTVLILGKEEFELNAFSYAFDKEINNKGEVTSKPKGGNLFISLQDIPKQSTLEWGIKHRCFKSGSARVMKLNEETHIQEEEVFFENAACTNLKLIYQRDGGNYLTTLLTISPESICIGDKGSWINKGWNL